MAKAAVSKRELCFRRMKEMFELSSRIEQHAEDKLTFIACYPEVSRIVDDFESAHLKIIQDATADFEKEDQVRGTFDRMQYTVKAKYYSLAKPSRSIGNTGETSGTSSQKVKLPKITLPNFSGDVALWPSFLALFNTSIHHNAQLSPMEKYQYLLSSLSGEALKIIKNLPFAAEHYPIAYDQLLERYENKRRLATHYWHALVQAKALKADSSSTLRQLLDTFNENTRALQLMKFPVDSWDFILLNILLDKLTLSLREKFEAEHRNSEIPKYSQLTKFLGEYCRVFASMADQTSSSVKPPNRSSKPGSSVSSFATKVFSCPVCKESHLLARCSQFLRLSPKERHSTAKKLNLCLNCLRAGHGVKSCSSKWTCRECKSQHHTLLHFEGGIKASSSASDSAPLLSEVESQPPTSGDQSVVSMTSISTFGSTVLLSTVRAEVLDVHGNPFSVRLILDSASQANFITENCMKRGGFRRKKGGTTVFAINHTKAASTRGNAAFVVQVQGRNDIRIPVEATILPHISDQFPNHQIKTTAWKHLEGLELADPQFHRPGPIDILLGAEIFTSLLRDGRKIGSRGEPDAFNTVFGWVLLGSVASGAPPSISSFLTLDSIDASVSRFWQLENIPEVSTYSSEDQRCEELFTRTTRREDGRFVVSYPFAKDFPGFFGSRQIAVNRFYSLERRFRRDPEFKNSYNQFMLDYLNSGHMELIHQPYPVNGTVYYLPHHGVVRLDSATTKLRVVFDASSRCTDGLSLNQTLLTGPKLQSDLLAVLLRFRIGAVALMADVKQMFRQIWLDSSQRDYQRIVWRFSEKDPLADYRLKTVTFGITPSPYLAIRCLLRLAEDGKSSHPLAADTLKSALYVDDVVTSVHSIKEARDLQNELQSLLASAGFELRKWASSHPAVLNGLNPEICHNSSLSLEPTEDSFLKVLGLLWYPSTDSFGFQVNPWDRECTKRTMLSELARIFDPLGFLTPLTFAAKRMIQLLWSLKLDWDDTPPPAIQDQWKKYKAELSALTSLRIPRVLALDDIVKRELHGFGDASERGYGAVVYLRIVTAHQVKIRLLGAKSKVAPLKSITIPRLELCAASLLSELLSYIHNILSNRMSIESTYAWSDSTIVLAWIRSDPTRWKTFVRNRVARIQLNTNIQCWGHVATTSNPADCCSRGLLPQELVDHPIWWTGPEWLLKFEPTPKDIPEFNGFPEEEAAKSSTFVVVISTEVVDSLLDKFSSLGRVVRIFAYCLRFINRDRSQPPVTSRVIDQVEFHSSLLLLVKLIQRSTFAEDLRNLQRKQRCSPALRKLVPFLDSNGILRVGGRLTHSALSYEAKHPALLPGRHRFTELLIEHTHRINLHPGRRALQYLLLQNFWIVGAHQSIKRCLAHCHQCFRANPRTLQPPMADLPRERVRQVKPFSITGVDYAGPFLVSSRRARGITPIKAYVCLFVCFTVKAVHLELAFSLSTESFLAALRRFISRRGRCSQLYSDCGTNFVGASKELVQHMRAAANEEKITWSFNPPSAPHFGGLWESGVKTMKTHLKRVVGEQILTIEEFSTLLAQIEAVMNSRPLCPLSADPNDLGVLSPGHFLTLEPLVSVPCANLELLPINRLSRWQMVQQMHQSFWKRWHAEYLHNLQQRPKWLDPVKPVSEGSLVLVKQENLPPLQWRRGRVTHLHTGRDGVPRVATVRTSDGSLKRPLVKLCHLPMDN